MSYTADEVKKALRDADNRVFPQPAPTNGQTVLASEVRRLRSVLANEVEHHVKRINEVAAQAQEIKTVKDLRDKILNDWESDRTAKDRIISEQAAVIAKARKECHCLNWASIEANVPAPQPAQEKSQVRINAEKDQTYTPYCLRCLRNVRMKIVEPFFWSCPACGARHDERAPSKPVQGSSSTEKA